MNRVDACLAAVLMAASMAFGALGQGTTLAPEREITITAKKYQSKYSPQRNFAMRCSLISSDSLLSAIA